MYPTAVLFVGAIAFVGGACRATAEEPSCSRSDVPLMMADHVSDKRAELSGVLVDRGRLLTISNEALDKAERQHSLQVFTGTPEGGYRHSHDAQLYEAPAGTCGEADFEALARDGDIVFAVTSHSVNRKRQRDDVSSEKNRLRLTNHGIETCDARHQLLKFRLTGDGKVEAPPKGISLRDLIQGHPVFERFAGIPNKENGVDIEGLAAMAGSLLVGFRGPVLRENYVPVLRLNQDLTEDTVRNSEVLFVNLDGRGIRDMTPGPGGVYILAGPNGDDEQTFGIYFWDGKDQVGGTGRPKAIAELRCNLGMHGAKGSAKPEGIAYLDTASGSLRFLLVYDGPAPLKAELRTIK